ncbi:uncharacterized protein LOC118504580 [Anopheles stephensi]|uniref:uncharacterized protein LOC118504580 n=1 Tax=Anopheles stephensi TaxID=30069 RepID=UPI0016588137|nr:uncharacterized protein LOC118504580 [Anopheles stephensi]
MERLWCYTCYLLLILSSFPVLSVLMKKDLQIKHFECYDLPYSQTNLEKCVIQTPRTGPQLLTLVMRTLNVIQRVFIDVVVYSQYQHTRTYLFGTSFDYCEFIAASDSYTNPVAKLVYAVALQKFPQALLECPASGVVNITDVKIDENLVPPIMPAGRYYTHFRMYNKRNQTLLAWKAKSIVSQVRTNQTMSFYG